MANKVSAAQVVTEWCPSISGTSLALAMLLTARLAAPSARADLVLETETAQLGKEGTFAMSVGTQFEREKDGTTRVFTLNQFEYAITDRAEILVEPFFFEYDHPKDGKDFSGMGDLEITPSYMIVEEQPMFPAIVLAFKVKIPTASNRDIGTREFDYQPFIIFGKTFGPWVLNLNFGYDFITSPPDEPLRDQFIADFSVERVVTPDLSLFAEVFCNSSPARGEKATYAGAVAAEYKFTEHFNVFVSVGYDTDHLAAVRTGFNWEF